ncbi:MAG: hypothetical protein JWN52_2089 [Actinomycetia bacterium]|nr:hypothetical protein [Actinomycetes bacterium]
MNDLKLIQQMRNSTPAITPQVEHAARTRLLDAITEDVVLPGVKAPRRRWARPHPIWGLGLAGVAAAAIAVAVVTSGTVPREPGPIRLDAATVLDRAADAVGAHPGVRPGPHQWIYIQSTHTTHMFNALNPRPKTDVQWLRADGQQIGFLRNRKLVVHNVSASEAGGYSVVASYDTLAKLPTDPRALLADIYKMPGDGGGMGSGSLAHQILGAPPLLPLGPGRNSRAFLNTAQLIWNSPVGAPPRVQAALYRAMAKIPGIKVDASARTITGQPAISLSGLLFDPHTYRMIGARSVTPNSINECSVTGGATKKLAESPKPHDCHVIPAGTVMNETLQTAVKFVGAPGQR